MRLELQYHLLDRRGGVEHTARAMQFSRIKQGEHPRVQDQLAGALAAAIKCNVLLLQPVFNQLCRTSFWQVGDFFYARHQILNIQIARMLKEIGFQVGTGVMIGIPGQTSEMLADDLIFMRDLDIDMIGMGPYIPHQDANMPPQLTVASVSERLALAYKMIAIARIVLRDVNIAATTALQALDEQGRERGLSFGANVMASRRNTRSVICSIFSCWCLRVMAMRSIRSFIRITVVMASHILSTTLITRPAGVG